MDKNVASIQLDWPAVKGLHQAKKLLYLGRTLANLDLEAFYVYLCIHVWVGLLLLLLGLLMNLWDG